MGRPTLSAEAITSNKISIIKAAMAMIREGGIGSVSARSLGKQVGMNSALIYRYFKDIDEVILFACVHVLQEYTRDMTEAMRSYRTSVEDPSNSSIYLLSWDLFSRHAFSNPEEYNTLFFSKHSTRLGSVISEYYKLFPQSRDAEDDIILEGMYRTSDLRGRNLVLLIPVLEGRKSDQEIIIINDLIISYFYALLTELIHNENVTSEYQTERMMKACRFTADL